MTVLTVLTVLAVLESTLPFFLLVLQLQNYEAAVAVLPVSAVMRFQSSWLPPLNSTPFFCDLDFSVCPNIFRTFFRHLVAAFVGNPVQRMPITSSAVLLLENRAPQKRENQPRRIQPPILGQASSRAHHLTVHFAPAVAMRVHSGHFAFADKKDIARGHAPLACGMKFPAVLGACFL